MSQIFNVKMAKSHLLPYAYAVNPELVEPEKEMHGDGMESESDEEPDEKMMAGEGAFHLHVHKHRIHLTPAHLKSLHGKKEVIFKKHMLSPYTKAKEHHFMVTKKMHRRIMRAHKHDKGIRIGAHHGEYGGLLMDETCRIPQIPATPYDKDQIPAVPSGDAMSSAAYKEATKYAVMKGGAKPHIVLNGPGRDRLQAQTVQGSPLPIFIPTNPTGPDRLTPGAANVKVLAGTMVGGKKAHAKLYGSSGSLRPILPAPSHMVQLGSPYAPIDSPAMSPFIPARNQNNGYNPI
jgi:hypothetical protein